MKDEIKIVGCRQHNLKNLSLTLPKNRLVVVTGVSGSGKSSLAFDTIYAEGQRRYLEGLSPQTRNSIRQLPKADVDLIEGLSPTLAIEQKISSTNLRGTVGLHTDLTHFIRLLFSRVGDQYSPSTNEKLTCYTRQEIAERVLADFPDGSRIQLIAQVPTEGNGAAAVERLLRMGFTRIRCDGQEIEADTELPPCDLIEVIVDRIALREGIRDRLGQSIETALDLSRGILRVQEGRDGPVEAYSEIYVCPKTGDSFAPLEPLDLNPLSSHGYCQDCRGDGGIWAVDPRQFCWQLDTPLTDQVEELLERLPRGQAKQLIELWHAWMDLHQLPVTVTPDELAADTLTVVLQGSTKTIEIDLNIDGQARKLQTHWKGLVSILSDDLSARGSKSSVAEMALTQWKACETCAGAGLKPEALACRIEELNIYQLCRLSVDEVLGLTKTWVFEGARQLVAAELIPRIRDRLEFLREVGLGYLALDRDLRSLSEGEAQRVHLASQLGASLSGVLYVLDEPSLGLHQRDVEHLSKMIQALRDGGNSILMVEHDAQLIGQAEQVIELGPGSGTEGGGLVFQGTFKQLLKAKCSPTGQWLRGQGKGESRVRRKPLSWLEVNNISCHNLDRFSAKIPLGVLTGICGVSGSGKSSLLLDVVAKELSSGEPPSHLSGYKEIERLNCVAQKGPGISSRSLPATYISVMTPLRKLFCETRLARARGYAASRFSLNKRGGRCEACEGLGQNRVSMQFMPDLLVPCDICDGKRYNYETLQVTWKGKSMADILSMTAAEAYEHLEPIPEVADKLALMKDLGLDYLQLGQPFATLSGGEIQRLKLVTELSKKSLGKTLYVLDEPSRGLHFSDVTKLMAILHRLVEAGHSVCIIEHNLDMLRDCDWLLELGPEGGPKGGNLIYAGVPEKIKDTPTAKALSVN